MIGGKFMKKFLSFACSIILALGTIGSAAASPFDTQQRNLDNSNVQVSDPRATTIPTEVADNKWWGQLHWFTCKYYTYSSYLFDLGLEGGYGSASAQCRKPFILEVYDDDNNLIDSETATKEVGVYRASVGFNYQVIERYGYIIIRNVNPDDPITLDDQGTYSVDIFPYSRSV